MSIPIAHILVRPSLWLEGLRTWWAMRIRGSIRINRSYLRWRRTTAYGNPDVIEDPTDLRAYLEWRRRQRRLPL